MSQQQVQPGLQDVQGNILSSYDVGCATYLFYRIDLVEPARQWLAALVAGITTEQKRAKDNPRSMLNVAVTFQGLKAFGISPNSLNSFPIEYQEGMKKRAATLCDFGESAPERWDNPLGMAQVHVLVLALGADRKHCDDKVGWAKMQVPQEDGAPIGVTLLSELQAEGLPDNKEHFGFRDSISQPWIEGTNPGPPIEPYGGKRTTEGFQPLNLGEFLLGYKDELDRVSSLPQPELLGRNGTYLILRKLHQDVAAFWSHMAKQASDVFGDSAAGGRLAALMVGRWPSGCPVELSSEKDNLAIAQDPHQVNAFTYDNDLTGNQCPIDAHIRRTNPRDLKLDQQGHPVVEPMSTRHRMIRRGLPYGPPLNGKEDDKRDRGLMFVALVADIGRQFEFLQLNWVNNGDPFRLDRTNRDPLIGNNRDTRDLPPPDPPGQPHKDTPRKFTVPAATRLPWALNLPEFVTTRGGEYFFLPSLTALQGLGSAGFSSFLKEYDARGKAIPDPAKRAIAQRKLISDWLIYRPKEMLDELLGLATGEKGRIFQMPGYLVFGDPLYSIPPIAIVTKYEDVLEVLDGARHPEFSVELYRRTMEIAPPRPPRGPFILGKNTSDPLYKLEMPLLVESLKKNFTMIPQILQAILDPIFDRIMPTGKLDVIQDLAWPVPLGLNDLYFGVPGPEDPDPDKKKTIKRWMRDIYKELFLNLRNDPEWTRAADKAALEMNSYLDGLIQQFDQNSDTVLNELIKIMKAPPSGLAPNFVRRNIMGLTVGVVETTLKAIARTIDQLIRRPKELKAAQAAARSNDKDTVLKYAFEAMRFNPQNHVLFRLCVADTKIAVGTSRETVIKKGTLVFASTLSAMFDDEGPFKQPKEFRLNRDPSKYLFFGYDGHECLGRHLVPLVLQEVLMRLLKLEELRRDNNDPFDPIELLPEHFLLEFNPGR